ncbi:MAG: BatD family protein [Myxococcales bacterium]|nr:BatD family protein [Myxococcales bacterium]
MSAWHPAHRRPVRTGLALVASGLLVLLSAFAASAQSVRVQVERAPYYVGEAFEVQVIAEDFEEEPTPEVEPGALDGATLQFVGVSPSTSTSITIVNGRMTRTHEVTFVHRFALTARREGPLRVPAFRVRQGTTERETRPFEVEVSSVPTSDAFEVRLELPEGPLFVGQKVPVAIELRIDRDRVEELVGYQLLVPFFESPMLRFLDDRSAASDDALEIQTGNGVLRLPASTSERTIGGRRRIVLRAERTMIPLAAEPVESEGPTAVFTLGRGFRQGFFGRREATSSERYLASGEPVRLEVVEVPREGRPASFAGAVGEGFSLEVTADRSVVQLGEPIELTLRLRGHGDLSTAGLPPLDAEGLFDAERFRLPEESPPGLVDDEGKTFEVTLRVLDASVREIPALAYSWFDAGTRRFETTRSRPIALSVGAAEVIGASAVASAEEAPEDEAFAGSRPAPNTPGGEEESASDTTTARRGSLALAGADLAVERDPAKVLGRTDSVGVLGEGALPVGLYGVGVALLAVALFDARRARRDPRLVRREALRRQARIEVERALAGSDPREVAAQLGRALRALVAELPEEAGAEFDALIAECDALRFAPEDSARARTLPPALADRARRFVAERGDDTRARASSLALLLLASGLLVGPGSGAASAVEAQTASSEAAATDEALTSARLAEALDAYQSAMAEPERDARLARFARAEAAFAALVADGWESAALQTNLGNAALQAEHPGRAVLAYHRALALDPDARAARQNLAYARGLLPAWVPRPPETTGLAALRIDRRVPASSRALAAAVCFALAAGGLALSVRRREGAWRGLALVAAIAWGLLLASIVVEAHDRERSGRSHAVVMVDDVPARSADSPLAPLALPDPLPAGVEVELLEERGDWARARLANGRDVWLRASSLERVRPG